MNDEESPSLEKIHRDFLMKRKLDFTEVDLSKDSASFAALTEKFSSPLLPGIVINDTIWVHSIDDVTLQTEWAKALFNVWQMEDTPNAQDVTKSGGGRDDEQEKIRVDLSPTLPRDHDQLDDSVQIASSQDESSRLASNQPRGVLNSIAKWSSSVSPPELKMGDETPLQSLLRLSRLMDEIYKTNYDYDLKLYHKFEINVCQLQVIPVPNDPVEVSVAWKCTDAVHIWLLHRLTYCVFFCGFVSASHSF
jgi:hypothetical protein